MSELKLLVWENDERLLVNPTDFDCVICGLSQDYRCVGAMLIEERDDDLLLKIGDVCLYCVVAGKSGAGERARERARYLRTGTEYRHLMHGKEKLLEKWATEREAMARQVARVIRWTTPQEQIAARAALAEMEAGLEPEE